MKSYVQSTSNKLKISSQFNSETYVTKPMLALDSTRYLKPIAVAPVVEYMLDNIIATALVAYSLRKLKSAYVGKCIKVRRSSDNATLDIDFIAATGLVDIAAVIAFAGGANLTIDTWYDQSGAGKDITQSTAGTQPTFNAMGDSDSNNKPYIYIGEGANKKLTNTSVNVNGFSEAILCCVGAPIGSQSAGGNTVDNAIFFVNENNSWGTFSMSLLAGQIAWRFGTGQSSNTNSESRTSSNSLVSAMAIKRSSNEFAYVNGSQLGSTHTGKITPTANSGSTLLVGSGDGGNTPNVKCLELICFSTAPVGTENTIYNSQLAAYSIF